MVKINIPDQQTSVGRRLFGMAAPIAGGAIGGPIGAGVGAMVGGRMAGQSVSDSLHGGVKTGLLNLGTSKLTGSDTAAAVASAGSPLGGDDLASRLGNQGNAFSRRMGNLSQSAPHAIEDGIMAMRELPNEDPVKQEYLPTLVKTQMLYKSR